MDYAAMNVVMDGIKSDLVREDVECASDEIMEELEARGLISEDGVLASVEEDTGKVVFLDEDEDDAPEGESQTEDLVTFLNTAAGTICKEYEGVTKGDAEAYIGGFIEDMVKAGDLPAFPEEEDVEAENKFLSAASDLDFMTKLRGWLETD